MSLPPGVVIDRIVRHGEVLNLKGSSYRLKGAGIDTLPPQS